MNRRTTTHLEDHSQPAVSQAEDLAESDLHYLAERIEVLSKSDQYLEWQPHGVVSRYFDGPPARVDLELPAVNNRQAYLSIRQLEFLVTRPDEQLYSIYGESLTARHFHLIATYRDTYYSQPLPAEEPKQSESASKSADLRFQHLLSSNNRLKTAVALGIFSVAAVISYGLKPEQKEANAAHLQDIDPQQTVHYYESNQIEDSFVPDGIRLPKEDTEGNTLATTPILSPEATTVVDQPLVLPAGETSGALQEEMQEIDLHFNGLPPLERIELAAEEEPDITYQASQLEVTVNPAIVAIQLRTDTVQSAGTPPSESNQLAETPTPVVTSAPTPVVPQEEVSTNLTYSLNDEQRGWLRAAGIAESDWPYVDFIMTKESNWQPFIKNKNSSAYGLCQRLISAHPLEEGERYMEDPVAQLVWCDNYAHTRYGSWERAYRAWKKKNWW